MRQQEDPSSVLRGAAHDPPPQLLGFSMVSILFFISSAKYNVLIEKKNIGVFQFLYFFSSFWGQFGPNCTTFLLAGAPACPMHTACIPAASP